MPHLVLIRSQRYPGPCFVPRRLLPACAAVPNHTPSLRSSPSSAVRRPSREEASPQFSWHPGQQPPRAVCAAATRQWSPARGQTGGDLHKSRASASAGRAWFRGGTCWGSTASAYGGHQGG
ncbi:hypothetical protein TRVL_04982 [Trypanosoma vivax]|nr:hypothetical protein TRVL_04982 [Trypanosoma vivax]